MEIKLALSTIVNGERDMAISVDEDMGGCSKRKTDGALKVDGALKAEVALPLIVASSEVVLVTRNDN